MWMFLRSIEISNNHFCHMSHWHWPISILLPVNLLCLNDSLFGFSIIKMKCIKIIEQKINIFHFHPSLLKGKKQFSWIYYSIPSLAKTLRCFLVEEAEMKEKEKGRQVNDVKVMNLLYNLLRCSSFNYQFVFRKSVLSTFFSREYLFDFCCLSIRLIRRRFWLALAEHCCVEQREK